MLTSFTSCSISKQNDKVRGCCISHYTLNAQLYYLLTASNKDTYYRMSLVADINISQGRVATHLRCGGILKYDYVANLLPSLTVKEF